MRKHLYPLLSGLLLVGSVRAQSTNPIVTSWLLNSTNVTGFNSLPANVQSVKYSNTSVYIAAKGITSFPATFVADGMGGPGTSWAGQPTNGPVEVPQTQYRYRLPLTPTPNPGTPVTVPNGTVGVWINGTGIYSAKDAASYNTSSGAVTTPGSGVWFTDAVVNEGVGFDLCNGHPDITSYYHTHVNPDCLYDRRDSTRHSPIIGFALDGYPIYGAYGYKLATDPTSGLKSMKSSYRQRSITVRTHLGNGTLAAHAGPAVSTTHPLGKFVEDNEYITGLGDLLANNGRWCVTPEYPEGTYAYFCTINSFYEGVFPYTVTGTYYGTVPYTPQGATSASITGSELAALQTYTIPSSLTVSTNKVLGGGTFTNVTVASGGNLVVVDPLTVSGAMTVQSGGALDLGTLDPNSATIGGTGTFTLASGAKIRLDNTNGLTSSGATGAVQNTGSRSFNAGAEYVYEHSAAQVTGAGLPGTVAALTVNNTGLTQTNTALTVSNLMTMTSGNVAVASGKTLTIPSGGTLTVAATPQVTGAGTFAVASGGALKTANTSGLSAAGTASGSIRTTTRTYSTGASYTYNGTAAQSTGNGLPTTMAGLTISNPAGVTLTNSTTAVSSALTLTSGTLTVPAAKTLTVTGTGTATTGTNLISGAGSFTLSTGGTFKTANPAGISAVGTATGAVQTTTARTFNVGASYEYNGTAAQVTGTGLPATVAGLTIRNSSGVTLSNDVMTSAALTLASGVLTTGMKKVTLGTTATVAETEESYVTGNVETARDVSAAGTAYNFGGLGLTLTPSGSTLPGSTTVLRVTGTAPTGLNGNQGIKRYFTITPTTNTGLDVALKLSYLTAELNGLNEASLRLFKSTASATAGPWAAPRYGTLTRDPEANWVSLGYVSGFSTWTLGSDEAPLPVTLTRFEAQRRPNGAVLTTWATASEKNSAGFVVERSADGRTFRAVSEPLAGAGTSSSPRAYTWTDASAPAGRLYYRLRQVDADGSASYSPVAIVGGTAEATAWTLYPNPATGVVGVPGLPAGQAATLYDALGRAVRTARAPAEADLLLPLTGLPAGVYVLRSGGQARRLVVE